MAWYKLGGDLLSVIVFVFKQSLNEAQEGSRFSDATINNHQRLVSCSTGGSCHSHQAMMLILEKTIMLVRRWSPACIVNLELRRAILLAPIVKGRSVSTVPKTPPREQLLVDICRCA